MEIVINPILTTVNDNTLNDLVNDVSREFKDIRVTIASRSANNSTIDSIAKNGTFQSLFDANRNQWNSPELIDWFYNKLKPNKDKVILVIMDVDAYSHGLNFVLGEAFPKGGLGVVYLARIKQEFYGLSPNEKIFYQRVVKECVHELGHIFGFAHCPNIGCVMHFSNTLSDTDIKGKNFCGQCTMKKPIF